MKTEDDYSAAPPRERYVWHTERRDDGLYYAVQQYGGWMRFQGQDEALAYITKQVERWGDSRAPEGQA